MGKTARRKPLQDPAVFGACLARIERLTPDSRPEWGKMSVGQMLAHCAAVQEVMNGEPLEGTPWYIRLGGPFVKWAVLASRPFPRGTVTHPQYLVTDEREFAVEKRRLLEALHAYRDAPSEQRGVDHAIFGRLTPEETGWASFKHLDHHLTQFGV